MKALTLKAMNQVLTQDLSDEQTARAKAFFAYIDEKLCADEDAITARMANAVIEQFGGWEEFTEEAQNAVQHGMEIGIDGWTWYNETEAFYNQHKTLIIKYFKDFSDSMGIDDSYLIMLSKMGFAEKFGFSIEQIAEFIYSSNSSELDDWQNFSNGMAWLVASYICDDYLDFSFDYDNT